MMPAPHVLGSAELCRCSRGACAYVPLASHQAPGWPRAAARAHRNEMLRGRDRVRKRVVLIHQPPALVPELAALAAAAHARNGVDDAALQQRHRRRVPLRVIWRPVRACAASARACVLA